MELSPVLYDSLVRPKWFIRHFIGDILNSHFDFNRKQVLDFGCGTGSTCFFFNPAYYTGIDCDQKRVRYARSLHPEYTFKPVINDSIPVADNTMDYVLIVSVLHHIHFKEFPALLNEFHRVLKSSGKIIIIEPCFFSNSYFSNFCMRILDRGKYIRTESAYLDVFNTGQYRTQIIKRFNQLLFYNKLLFTAAPVDKS